jgi:hypothetical protein
LRDSLNAKSLVFVLCGYFQLYRRQVLFKRKALDENWARVNQESRSMLPVNQTKSRFASFTASFTFLLRKVQGWIRQEIVDDDPWDEETLNQSRREEDKNS